MSEQKRQHTPEEFLAELSVLRAKLDSLEHNILRMWAAEREREGRRVVPPPPPVRLSAVPVQAQPPPIAPEEPSEALAEKLAKLQPAAPPAEKPAPEAAPSVAAAAKPERPSLEQRIGTRWMLYAGVTVTLIGAVLFFMYAIEKEWITKPMRCIIGAVAGLIAIGVGEWTLRQRMRLFAAGLFGIGVVCFYLSVYVASPGGLYTAYDLISTKVAFGLMCVVTLVAVGLSLRSGMLAGGIIALVGAIATPVMLTTGKDHQVVLMCYLLVVNAGFLTLSLMKRWQALAPIALAGTVLLTAGWAFKHYNAAKLASTTAFAWAYLALFWTYVAAGVHRRRAHEALAGTVLLIANVAVVVLAAAICESAADTHTFAIQMLVMLAGTLAYALWRKWDLLMVWGAGLGGMVIWGWSACRYDPSAIAAMCGYAWVYLAVVLAAIVLAAPYRWRIQSIGVVLAASLMMIGGWLAMGGDLQPNAFALQLLLLNAIVLVFARWREWGEMGVSVVVWTVAALTAKYIMWDNPGVEAADFITLRMWPLFALIVLDVLAYRRRQWQDLKAVQLAGAAVAMVAGWLVMNQGLTWSAPHLVMMWQLLTLNVIVLGICMCRGWNWLRGGVVGWTVVAMAVLHLQWCDTVDMTVFTSQWAWVMFGLISLDVLLRVWWKRLRTIEWLDAVMATVSMGVMFGATYGLLRADYQRWMGTYTASLAVGAIALAIVIRRLSNCRRLAYAYLGQGLVFAALAVPIEFDKSTVALAWCILGTVAIFLAKRLHNRILLLKGVVVLGLAVIHFVAMDMPGDPRIREVFLQAGSVGISYAVVLAIGLSAALLGSAAMLRLGAAICDELGETILAYIMVVSGLALFYGITAIELPVLASTWWWLVAAGGVAAVAVWRNADRLVVVGAVALLAVVLKWAWFDTLTRRLWVGADVSGLLVLNWQFTAGVVMAAAILIWLWEMRYWDISAGKALMPWGNVLAGLLVIWAGSFEVDRYFQTEAAAIFSNRVQMMHMAYSLWWGIGALMLLAAGFIWSRREVRYLALCILAVTVVKVFVKDMRALHAVYHILSAVGVGLLLLVGAFVYTRVFRPKKT